MNFIKTNMKRIFKNTGILPWQYPCFYVSSCEATRNANNARKELLLSKWWCSFRCHFSNNVGKGGNSELGAVIGGVVERTAGVLIGNRMDKQACNRRNSRAQVERIDDAIVITFDEGSGVILLINTTQRNSEPI